MIELMTDPYCHDCSDFEPIVQRLYANDEIYLQIVTCKDLDRCRKMYEHIRKFDEEQVVKGENDA